MERWPSGAATNPNGEFVVLLINEDFFFLTNVVRGSDMSLKMTT